MIPVMKKYDSAAAMLELKPLLVASAGSGGIGGAPVAVTGDPHALQKADPSFT